MKRTRWVSILGGMCLLVSAGLLVSRAQDPVTTQDPALAAFQEQLPVEHPECTFFGPQRDMLVKAALKARGLEAPSHALSDLTERAVQMMNYVPPGSPTYGFQQAEQTGSIDSYIY
ncbi:MAG TPA: hypothetical protein VGS58_10720, partial [Candidatus Sulfopaludibacter sp.]|nr:hypothetical protein [Candidatus Sulfopaludibacter sp.]